LSRLAAAVAAAGLWLAAPAWAAEDEPAIGIKLDGVLVLAGRQVPLPAGTWMLAGRSFEKVPELDNDAYGAIESEVLFRIEDDTVVAFIIANRNLLPVEDGWGTASECIGEDVRPPVVVTYDRSITHAFCAFAAPFDTAVEERTAGSWKAAVAYAEAQGLALPKHWLMAGFRLSNAQDVLDVRYNFAAALAEDSAAMEASPSPTRLAAEEALATIMPAAAPQQASAAATADQGATAAAAGPSWWSGLEGMMPGWLSGDEGGAKHAVAIEGLSHWLEQMRGPIQLGFNNELSGREPPPMPWTAVARAPTPSEADKLARLEALRQAGVIDEARFAEQSRLIAADEPRMAEQQISSGNLTLIKVVADQVTAAVPTFIGNWVVLGTVPQAAALLGIQTAVDFVHDYSTELAWNVWGPQRIREEPAIDFPGAGHIPGADND
jgi:hypothetical protein